MRGAGASALVLGAALGAVGALGALGAGGCGGSEAVRPGGSAEPRETVARVDPRLPRAPGEFSPSLVKIDRSTPHGAGEVSDGTMLADVDSCSSCHPDAAAQWSTSAHSFASFGNPLYRENVELLRKELGKPASRHCGGCHDMPLLVDGLMTSDAPIPAADLRAHSGVTCRLCHGIDETTKDGNGSYVWSRTPLDAPVLGDAASIARHKQQVAVKSLGAELCVGCHRGFLSPDMGMPVHLSGLDEPGMWRNSAWTGNGMARIDKVDQRTCVDCHMEREPASRGELGAKAGTLASHRFLGGHTWMASMRGDREHLRRTQAKLEGVASIDVAGVRVEEPGASAPRWHLPADGAPVRPGMQLGLDVVIRNLLAGHRFPGGVLDIQDTWIEVEVADRTGKRLASSGLSHETDPKDEDTHVLRTLVVDEHGAVLEEHEMARFRTQIATQTLAPREAQVVRYAFEVPQGLAPAQLPLTVKARLRHRSRTLQLQAVVCREARTQAGREFIAGARGARDVELDPCRAQPITLIAEASVQLGEGAAVSAKRPAWERMYEHGMALVGTVTERLEEARGVLEAALAAAPDARARAMVSIQLGWVASKQGRSDDALALVARSRELLASINPSPGPSPAASPDRLGHGAGPGKPAPSPPVLDAVAADALARVWHWEEAVAPAKACTERAPQNSAAWVLYARVLGSVGDNAGALAAANRGLELAPRDPDLLRSQATALAALGRPEADAALAAYDRFRSPDNSAELRIQCAAGSVRCARDREAGHTLALRPAR
jgi:tetratricopeptide (TPR) repeat protein